MDPNTKLDMSLEDIQRDQKRQARDKQRQERLQQREEQERVVSAKVQASKRILESAYQPAAVPTPPPQRLRSQVVVPQAATRGARDTAAGGARKEEEWPVDIFAKYKDAASAAGITKDFWQACKETHGLPNIRHILSDRTTANYEGAQRHDFYIALLLGYMAFEEEKSPLPRKPTLREQRKEHDKLKKQNQGQGLASKQ